MPDSRGVDDHLHGVRDDRGARLSELPECCFALEAVVFTGAGEVPALDEKQEPRYTLTVRLLSREVVAHRWQWSRSDYLTPLKRIGANKMRRQADGLLLVARGKER